MMIYSCGDLENVVLSERLLSISSMYGLKCGEAKVWGKRWRLWRDGLVVYWLLYVTEMQYATHYFFMIFAVNDGWLDCGWRLIEDHWFHLSVSCCSVVQGSPMKRMRMPSHDIFDRFLGKAWRLRRCLWPREIHCEASFSNLRWFPNTSFMQFYVSIALLGAG